MPGISQAVPTSFKLESLQGIHNFASDVFKIALYDSTVATLGATTAAYLTTGEITGTGYNPGGSIVSVAAGWPQIFNGIYAGCRFNDQVWPSASFSADGALIYNSSKANRAVLVLAFPARQSPFAGNFTIRFPLSLDPIVNFK